MGSHGGDSRQVWVPRLYRSGSRFPSESLALWDVLDGDRAARGPVRARHRLAALVPGAVAGGQRPGTLCRAGPPPGRKAPMAHPRTRHYGRAANPARTIAEGTTGQSNLPARPTPLRAGHGQRAVPGSGPAAPEIRPRPRVDAADPRRPSPEPLGLAGPVRGVRQGARDPAAPRGAAPGHAGGLRAKPGSHRPGRSIARWRHACRRTRPCGSKPKATRRT